MKKSNKLKPILTATLLVLPSFLFLSPSQKSNAKLLQTLRTSTIKFNPKISIPTNINLKTQIFPKNFSNKPSNAVSTSGKLTKFKVTPPTGVKLNQISVSRTQSTSSTGSHGKVSIKKPISSSQSLTSTNSVQLDDNPTPIAQRLVLHLQKNGIKPENPSKIQLSSSSSRLSSSEA